MEKNKYKIEIDGTKVNIALPEKVLGGSEAMEFSSLVHKHLNDDKINLLILDLDNVEVMNSSGLGMLVAAYTSAKKIDKKIKFVNIPNKIMKLLEMTHLNQVFLK